MKIYRQSGESALVFANCEEDIALYKKRKLSLIIVCVLAFILSVVAGILLMAGLTKSESELDKISLSGALIGNTDDNIPDNTIYEELAANILRLHIVANSDSADDQEVKLLVRNAVVAWISDNMENCSSKEDAWNFLRQNIGSITDIANSVLKKKGFSYTAVCNLGISHFPGKVYGDFYLPAGDYDSLKIVLGEGSGHNWWCIAFPCLCLFGNADYEDVSGNRSSYEAFDDLIGGECYDEIRVENVKIDFKCKWFKKIFS